MQIKINIIFGHLNSLYAYFTKIPVMNFGFWPWISQGRGYTEAK